MNAQRPSRPAGAVLFLACVVFGLWRPAEARPLLPNPGLPAGPRPLGLVAGDWDGDGDIDLVTAAFGLRFGGDTATPRLTLFRGRGDGTFLETALPVPGAPAEARLIDADTDGRSDLIVRTLERLTQTWMLLLLPGRGDGTFAPPRIIASAALIDGVDVAELDADGRPDLVVWSRHAGGAFFYSLLGNGDGTFVQRADPVLVNGPWRGAVGDLDGDGRDDVAAPYGGRSDPLDVRIYRSRGDGSFAGPTGFATGIGAERVFLSDVGGDGAIDLAITGTPPEGVSSDHTPFRVYRGLGDGSFASAPAYRSEQFAIALLTDDFDSDGRTDFATLNTHGEAIVHVGRPGDTHHALPALFAGDEGSALAAGDFDRDGRPDLAAASIRSSTAFLFFGNGDGTFGPRGVPGMDLRFLGSGSAALADFDGDGRPDLAAAQVGDDAIAVAPGLGDGGFGPASRLAAPPLPFLLAAADLDGNGRPDLAALSVGCEDWDPDPCPGIVSVFRASGGGLQSRTDYAVGIEPSSLVIADLDANGLPDLVAGSYGAPGGAPGAVTVLLGRGQGAFATLPDVPPGTRVADLAVGDVDGDGRPDLMAVGVDRYFLGEPSELRLAAGLGDGMFGAWRVLDAGTRLGSVDLADLDGDGDLDALVTDRAGNRPFASGTLRVYLGDGAGGFSAVPPAELEIPAYDATVTDFDHDGIPDAALSAADSRETLLLAGSGDGRFVPRLTAALDLLALAAHDVDGDRRADRIVASTAGTFVLPAPAGLIVRATLSFTSPLGRGSGTLAWTTERETDLRGFNIIVFDAGGRRLQVNEVLIPCEESVTGLGAAYAFFLPKHRGGREVYVEAVFRDGRTAIYGPARRE